MNVSLTFFIALEINKNVYILYIQHMYTLQVCMSTSGTVIHYMGRSCQSRNSPETMFQWEFRVLICVLFSGTQPWCKTRPACTLNRNVYTLYMQYIYTLQVCMFTSGIVIHYI